jgi:hypothetical protein
LARAGRIAPAALTGEKERGFGAPANLLGSTWDGVGAKVCLSSVRAGLAERKRGGGIRTQDPTCSAAIERFGGARDIAGRWRSAAVFSGETP